MCLNDTDNLKEREMYKLSQSETFGITGKLVLFLSLQPKL